MHVRVCVWFSECVGVCDSVDAEMSAGLRPDRDHQQRAQVRTCSSVPAPAPAPPEFKLFLRAKGLQVVRALTMSAVFGFRAVGAH